MAEIKENEILIFQNTEATKENKRPVWKGKLMLNETLYHVSLWKKYHTETGEAYLQGNIKEAPPKVAESENQDEPRY